MSYISHEDYKDLMSRFQANSPKGVLKEAVEEGNAFTAALAKTKKGDKAKVDGKEITDTSNYDDPSVKEYGYADQPPAGTPASTQYPEAWSFREGMDHPGEAERTHIDNIAGRMKDRGMDAESIYDVLVGEYDVSSHVAEAVIDGLFRNKQEGEGAKDSTIDIKELFKTPLPGADKDRFQKVASVKKLGTMNPITGKKDSLYQVDIDDRDLDHAVRVAKDMIDKGIEDNYILYHLTTVDGLSTADARIAINQAFDDNNYDTQPYHVKAFREGLNPAPLQATGPTISTVEEDHMQPFKLPKRTDTSRLDYDPDASRFEPDYMKAPGEEDDDFDDDVISDTDDEFDLGDDIPAQFKRAVAGDKKRYPFLRENQAPYGFSVLSPDERKQLKEYIESVKTIKKEIAKLAAKAGKKVKMESGDTTGLMMNPSVTSEAISKEKIEQIEERIPEKLYAASEKIIRHLKRAGLTPGEIKAFLNHEVEEMAEKAIEAQYDLHENSKDVSKKKVNEAKWMRSTGYPKNRNKFGYQNMKLKVVPNPNAGKYRIVSLSKSGGPLDDRFFDTEEEAREVSRTLSSGSKIIKMPDTMTVYTT